jgi:hypothetical protein
MDLNKNFCSTCSSERQYSEKYDAHFCELCNKWLEDKCSDPGCFFCAERPEKPSMVRNETTT